MNHDSLIADLHYVSRPLRCPPLTVKNVLYFRSDLVERNSMLRTKAMREKDEQRERRKYNYALVRVRLPDGNILQGMQSCVSKGSTK